MHNEIQFKEESHTTQFLTNYGRPYHHIIVARVINFSLYNKIKYFLLE